MALMPYERQRHRREIERQFEWRAAWTISSLGSSSFVALRLCPFEMKVRLPDKSGSAIPLKRFKVTFNYSKSQLILEPGKMYGQRAGAALNFPGATRD